MVVRNLFVHQLMKKKLQCWPISCVTLEIMAELRTDVVCEEGKNLWAGVFKVKSFREPSKYRGHFRIEWI